MHAVNSVLPKNKSSLHAYETVKHPLILDDSC